MTKYTIREYYENKCDSWRLCEVKSKSLDYSLEGIYNTEGFYCVNTKDRSNEEIATTEQHEIAHVLVDEDLTEFFPMMLRHSGFRVDRFPSYNPRDRGESIFEGFIEARKRKPWLWQDY